MISCSAVAAALHAVTNDASSSGPQTIVFVLAILAAGTLVGIWKFRNALSRRRTKALANAAIEMGFTFDGETRAPYLQTALFGKGYSRKFENIMTSDRAGLVVRLFDYSFVVGTGKSQQTYTQTVASFSKDHVSLPYFELRPANMLGRAWDAMAHKNIHFETEPEFARRYALQGTLPDKVRELFTPSLISLLDGLDAHEKWHIEGVGSTLVIYRADKKTAPEQMRTFLEQTSQIATTFLSFARIEATASTRN